MSSIQPSSGSNYNPFRTENDKPTSDAPITGMGKLSGNYGKTGNWFFRKAYNSVAALFSGKYWRGGWFAQKQSESDTDATSLSGRFSSVSTSVSDRNNAALSGRFSSVSDRSSIMSDDVIRDMNPLPSQDEKDYALRLQAAAADEFHAAINAAKRFSAKPSNDDVEFTDEEVASLAANRQQRRGYAHASDFRDKQADADFTATFQKLHAAVQSAENQFGEGSEKATDAHAERQKYIDDNPEIVQRFDGIYTTAQQNAIESFKEAQKKLEDNPEPTQEGFQGMFNVGTNLFGLSTSIKDRTTAQQKYNTAKEKLASVGLSYDTGNNKFSKKKGVSQ